MLEHPDEGLNANINRWIAKILTYHFTLVHVPGKTHGPDSLSRRPWAEGDIEYPRDAEDDIEIKDEGMIDIEYPYGDLDPPLAWEDFKDEIDTRTGFMNVVALAESVEDFQDEVKRASEEDAQYRLAFTKAMIKKLEADCNDDHKVAVFKAEELLLPTDEDRNDPEIREQYPEQSQKAISLESRIEWIKLWLSTFDLTIFNKMKGSKKRFLKLANKFMLGKNKKLYRKDAGGKHCLYVEKGDRMYMMKAGHDSLGHRGAYATRSLLEERFWWPDMESDVRWYVKTCHKCQLRIARYHKRSPEVTYTPALFEVCHADTMHMPKPCGTYNLVMHARDSLTSWPELRAATTQNAVSCAEFLFEDIICRWGLCRQIVTDNAPLWLKAVQILEDKYGIRGVSISPYNSQANGKIERYHLDVREALAKATGDNLTQWRHFLPHVAWSERITVRKKFGCSPYFMVTGSHPILPLDVLEATWLVELPDRTLTTEELIGYRAQALYKHQTHVVAMRERVTEEKRRRVLQYEKDNLNRIITKTFKPGDLVLMRNTAIEESKSKKVWPRYLGPLIVIKRNKNGSYILSEMDGATLHQPVTEFRVIPYHARKSVQIPDNIHDLIDISASRLAQLENAETRWDEPLSEEVLYPKVKIYLGGDDKIPEDEEALLEVEPPIDELAYGDDDDEMAFTVKTRTQRKKEREAKKKLREAQEVYALRKKDQSETYPWRLGVHVNNDEPFIENAVLDASRLGARSFALFLKSEKRWKGHYMTPGSAMRFMSNMRTAGIEPEYVLPHGSYLINLANLSKVKRNQSVLCLLDDLKRCKRLGLPLYNLHPGAATDGNKADGIDRVAEGLNLAHAATSEGRHTVTILLETMAGGGTQLGGRFEEIRAIIDKVKDKSRIGVCLDTCHLFSAGYNLKTKEGWRECLADFDRVIGAPYLRAIHMNDSQHEIASRRDRHDNLGLGFMGVECFVDIVTNPRFQNMPIVMETPSYENPDIHIQELESWNQFCADNNKEALLERIGTFRYEVLRAREDQEKRRQKKIDERKIVSLQLRHRDKQFFFTD
jgi:apurinic endonuclease APN1